MADLDSLEHTRPPLLAGAPNRLGHLLLQSLIEGYPALVTDADEAPTYMIAPLASGRALLRAFIFP